MAVIEARGAGSDEVASEVQNAINVIAEQYPELKSSENYRELMNELSVTENLIASYRENYNDQIKEYNRYTRKFPNNILLNMAGYAVQGYEYLEYEGFEDAPTNLFGE
jgi:LemA protein